MVAQNQLWFQKLFLEEWIEGEVVDENLMGFAFDDVVG